MDWNVFFAWAPWVLFLAVIVATYVATRGSESSAAPIGQTFACNACGRRSKREHMVPVTTEGSVLWYCASCAPQPTPASFH
ncbi:MAG: hypothetical protein JOZ38_11295 [Candidatus Eremiobacteraeota bacterium]|nr:hypothetical protein [Candidatus Eremiobacteraeota bacterium]